MQQLQISYHSEDLQKDNLRSFTLTSTSIVADKLSSNLNSTFIMRHVLTSENIQDGFEIQKTFEIRSNNRWKHYKFHEKAHNHDYGKRKER